MHTPDNVPNGAERTDGKNILTKLINIFAPCFFTISGVISERREGTYPRAATGIPLYAFNGRIKLSFVSSELLQSSNAAAGAYDCHQVARLHLLFYKFLERAAYVVCAFEREAEIVDNESDGAAHVLRMQFNRRERRCIFIWRRGLRQRRNRGF